MRIFTKIGFLHSIYAQYNYYNPPDYNQPNNYQPGYNPPYDSLKEISPKLNPYNDYGNNNYVDYGNAPKANSQCNNFCVSRTKQGYTCAKWTDQRTHPHNEKMVRNISDFEGSADHNCCRRADPDDEKPWCYTTDPNKKFDYCDFSSCGQPSVKLDVNYDSFFAGGSINGGKIYGGKETKQGSLPWQANLLMGGSTIDNLICGGSVLSAKKIISAAHCFKRTGYGDPRRWLAVAGHVNLAEYQGVQRVGLNRITLHPQYNAQTKTFDLAILQTQQPFRFDDYVKPVCLPTPGFGRGLRDDGGTMIISGMGRIDKRSEAHPLRIASIPMQSKDQCAKNREIGSKFNPELMICGGTEGIDTCKGDSGGPLVAHVDGSFVLAGVTSWGIGCGRAGSPGVYVDVSNPKILNWIQNTA